MLKKLKQIKLPVLAQDLLLLLILIVLAHLLFYPARAAGFVTDFGHYPFRFEGKDWTGIFYSFGYPGVQPLTMVFNYYMFSHYQIAYLPWHLLFVSVHALNAWLLFVWLKSFLNSVKFEQNYLVAIIAAFLFLVNPFSAEPVVWKCTFQYLLSTLFFLLSLLALNKYLIQQHTKNALLVASLFFASLLSFELTLGGIMVLVAISFFYHKAVTPGKPFKRRLPGALYFPLGSILIYFILTAIQTGTLIPHYGASTHLHFNIFEILSNYLNYFIKYAIDSRMWSPDFRQQIRIFTGNQNYGLLAVISITIAYLIFIYFFKRIGKSLQLTMLFLLCFGLALIPVINLYFYDIGYIENDRYGYFACAFFYIIPAIWISKIKGPYLGAAALILIGIQSYFLLKMNLIWGKNADVYNNLIDTYSWADKENVYILAMADNLQGSLLFRDLKGEVAFKDAYSLIAGHHTKGKIHDLAQFNMTSAKDGVNAKWKDPKTIIIEFKQWGNWWWRKGIGMSSWETDQFKVTPNGQQCEIAFKSMPKDAVFIYQDGKEWRKLE